MSRRFYVTPAFIDYFRDRFTNVEHRVTPGVGGGFFIIDTSDVEWNVDLLAGYRYTQFRSVPAGDDRSEETAALVPATRADVEISSDVDLILEYRAEVNLSDIQDINHHTVATLSVELTRTIDLDVSLIWDRDGKPERDSTGDIPEKDDVRLVVGFGLDF